MDEAKRIEELRQDIIDYQVMMGQAQDANHYAAADTCQDLIYEARRHIAIILNDGLVPA